MSTTFSAEPMRPIVAVTMGDPAGVGPEVVARTLGVKEVWEACRPLVIGDVTTLRRACALVKASYVLNPITEAREARFSREAPDIVDLQNVVQRDFIPGEVSAMCGRASVDYVERAASLVLEGQADAMTTGPINKAALRKADIPYIGHTEMLSALTGEDRVTTMLATPGLRVVHVTRHVPLREVAVLITRERVVRTIRIANHGLKRIGIPEPRIGVAALNPHGGEDGLLGSEELDVIGPAIAEASGSGINVAGPIPADSIYFRAIAGEFDVVVAMYHDQGHIAVKTHDFSRSITLTLGLPIIRTSVDHGTAFGIAWKGQASDASMVHAIQLAAQIATGKPLAQQGVPWYKDAG
jgi:4-hydroxythreonine-4-phosphate dehydrogenase